MRILWTAWSVASASVLVASAIRPAEAQSSTRPAAKCLCGKVRDSSGSPIADVDLEMVTGTDAASLRGVGRTSGDGSFSFKAPELGTGELRLRRLGYVPKSIAVLFDTLTQSRTVTIILDAAPVELASVEVEAPATSYLRDFNDRRKKRGTGHFIDRTEIAKRRPAYTSDLLRSLPGVTVRVSSRIGSVVRVRGCRPAVFIDGIQAVGAELDDVTRPGDIEGMEIYSSWAGIPPQFKDRQGGNCGAIIVWTRIG